MVGPGQTLAATRPSIPRPAVSTNNFTGSAPAQRIVLPIRAASGCAECLVIEPSHRSSASFSGTPDHVAVEVGFVAYLRLKEAYALTTGDQELAAMTRRAAARFVTEHLSMMAEALATLLAGSGIEYLAHASTLLAARVGPKPKFKLLPVLQPDPMDDESGSEFPCDV